MQTFGRYRVVREVARGGTGAVHRALAPDETPVALKLLLSGRAATPMQRRRFAGEVQALLRIRHPHVVGLLDAGEFEGTPFLVMEWIEGETLAERLHRSGVLEPRAAAELGLALAGALEHCHAQGVLHRDLKPENVLLRAGTGAPLLTDFGLAKDLLPEAGDVTHGSVQGALLGTPGYWPPEQARGQLAAIGPRSDVYGLCAIVWAAIVGRAPQKGANLQTLLRELDGAPMAPGELVPGVPDWLDTLLVRGLDPLPERRPASAAELELALRAGLTRKGATRFGPALAASLALIALGLAAAVLVVARPASPPATHAAAIDSRVAPIATAAIPASASLGPVQLAARGFERFHADDVEGAREDCALALAAEPELPEALLLQSSIRAAAPQVTKGEVRAAIAVVDRVIAAHPEHARAWHVRADLRAQLEDEEGRERDLRRSLELDPRVLEVVIHLVDIHEARGDHAGALGLLDRYLEHDPRETNALRSRAVVRQAMGDRAGARADLDLALAIDPRSLESLLGRAELLIEMGDLVAARKDCERALELAPGSAEAWTTSAHLRIEGDDLSGGERDLDRAIELLPESAVLWSSRGLLRKKRGARAEARADLDRAIRLEQHHAEALRARAELRRADRDLAGARDDLTLLLQGQPGDLEAWIARATVRLELGDAAGARADAGRCIELAPDRLEGWVLRARALELGNDLPGAIAAYDRALERRLHVPQLLLRRAELKRQQGDAAGARADLEQALGLPWPESGKADRERAEAALEQLR